ncbi:MAG: hypothetical protein ACRDD7_17165 [Peptostreptococcaceae bacterium]
MDKKKVVKQFINYICEEVNYQVTKMNKECFHITKDKMVTYTFSDEMVYLVIDKGIDKRIKKMLKKKYNIDSEVTFKVNTSVNTYSEGEIRVRVKGDKPLFEEFDYINWFDNTYI